MTSTTSNLVPIIRKEDFEKEATEFLSKYSLDSLERPSAVPITKIAVEKMGLKVLYHRLTEDFSVFGQMCFGSGKTEIYDNENDEYRLILVEKGTMIIDPDTYELRNLGCLNNTIAHESYHWYKHRAYHILRSTLDNETSVAMRCPVQQTNERFTEKWSDEDWMEWHANNIAPRILMPIQTVKLVFDKLYAKSKSIILVANGLTSTIEWVKERMADFYKVSKQSAGIRLKELGYDESN